MSRPFLQLSDAKELEFSPTSTVSSVLLGRSVTFFSSLLTATRSSLADLLEQDVSRSISQVSNRGLSFPPTSSVCPVLIGQSVSGVKSCSWLPLDLRIRFFLRFFRPLFA
ncbi:hypothetical protein OUZ56_013156 [Daphnia magna]|uniref:Uncharacterized protein n=1 Tax=Daphnia magna TaxID=35525 RepID=A0ABQ9Z521_9CRUS|nr:hypothetical protein OUZ56_013156 [Daphnia magna]